MYREAYHFPLERYISNENFKLFRDYVKDIPTPILLIDVEKIRNKYRELARSLPMAKIYYAVKANPRDEVVSMLAEEGSNFDIASRYELDQMLRHGIDPERLSYGNTIKKRSDIEYFYSKGVRMFATDSENDLKNIAELAPGSRLMFRILTEGTGADWPLSRKFGSHSDVIYYLILQAKELGLIPWGVSFHVGSQQRDIGQWDDAIARCKCATLPLHEHCLFKLGVHLGEMFYLTPLAQWLRKNGRNRFLLTAPPLRLPGAVGSPSTAVATV